MTPVPSSDPGHHADGTVHSHRFAAELQERHVIGQPVRSRGDLHHSWPQGPHRVRAVAQVRRDAVEIVHRQDDSCGSGAREQPLETRTPLDVDVLCACIKRVEENRLALLLAAVELPAFPAGPARHDDRTRAPAQRAADVNRLDAIETELHHIGTRRRVSRGEELGHGPAGHGFNEERCVHCCPK